MAVTRLGSRAAITASIVNINLVYFPGVVASAMCCCQFRMISPSSELQYISSQLGTAVYTKSSQLQLTSIDVTFQHTLLPQSVLPRLYDITRKV